MTSQNGSVRERCDRRQHATQIYPRSAFGANPEFSEQDVIRAAETASAHAFITGLENGYDTVVGDRGVILSGGQRQRIAIARALIRVPELLVLDEATSSLDSDTEKDIFRSLKERHGGCTMLVVSHRDSVLEYADKVIRIKNGKIAD